MVKQKFKESKDVKKWLDVAHHDLDVAFLLDRELSFTDTICNFCHQSAEKAFKAFLIKQGVFDFPHTHDLEALLAQCKEFSKDFGVWLEEIGRLNKYYIETKYPPDIPRNYSRKEAKQAIESATKILEFVERIIKNDIS